MVSAKSKEEHIVEGLESGANDYVVKPFGRQEILARISAHLGFRNCVYEAGELAGGVPSESGPPRVLIRGGSTSVAPVDITPFLRPAQLLGWNNFSSRNSMGGSMHGAGFFSLPKAVRNMLCSTTAANTLQVYSSVTLVEVGISNLQQLLDEVSTAHLLRSLADLHAQLDTLLSQHGCTLMECFEDGRFVIAAGLEKVRSDSTYSAGPISGAGEGEEAGLSHAADAIALCKGLLGKQHLNVRVLSVHQLRKGK